MPIWKPSNPKPTPAIVPEGAPNPTPSLAPKKRVGRVFTRYICLGDISKIAPIDFCSFPNDPWSEGDFYRIIGSPYVGGYVAFEKGVMLGYWIQELHPGLVNILRLAVHPAYRRMSIGSQMLGEIIGKLSPVRRQKATILIPEDNLVSQQFLRSCGFKAMTVIRGRDESSRDSYLFEYNI
jgi:ribosomal protein S18 acetylase RimI-like enzyme